MIRDARTDRDVFDEDEPTAVRGDVTLGGQPTDRVLWPLDADLGTIRDLIDDAQADAICDAYGRIHQRAEVERYLYDGRDLDATNPQYSRIRHFDPTVGRFLSEDPVGCVDGLNLYRYVGNAPLNDSDPTNNRDRD